MATALKSPPSSNPAPKSRQEAEVALSPVWKVFDGLYRFFASLKLAVFSLLTLSAVLAYATFFESWYGTHAVQEWIYQSKAFALLLAFLGVNIFCAALIRFRWDDQQKGWTRRQTGFVITHVGLLTVLLGSWITLRTSDEGQIMLSEGGTTDQMVRIDNSVIRVQTVAAETGKAEGGKEFELPFRHGAFSWDSVENAALYANTPHVYGVPLLWNPRAAVALGAFLAALALFVLFRGRTVATVAMQALLAIGAIFTGFYFWYPTGAVRTELLTEPRDPFRLIVKDFVAASSNPYWVHDGKTSGPPKIKMSLDVQPPNAPSPIDIFQALRMNELARWLVLDESPFAVTEFQGGPLTIRFFHVDTPDKLDDFLHPPKDPLNDRQARFHYTDRHGKLRVFEWKIDDKQSGKPFTLPDSDLAVKYTETRDFPLRGGEEVLRFAEFMISKGAGEPVRHLACAGRPMFPNISPGAEGEKRPQPLLRVSLYEPPPISREAMGRRAGMIEVMATDKGALYYRGFTRHGMRGPAPLKVGDELDVFGPQSPMKAHFRVDEYRESGGLKKVHYPLELPKGQSDSGIPAALVELQTGNERAELWLRRKDDIDEPVFQDLTLGGKRYRLAFDFDRRSIGFDMTLLDFRMGTDPGTQEASSYTSKIVVNDPSANVRDKAVTITMNEPMVYRNQTFYQTSFRELRDPETDRKTGDKKSVIQVGIDPYWSIKYIGCLTVVLGAFVQFYMRAGVFTDGGKLEQARAAEKARRRLEAKQPPRPTRGAAETIDEFEEL
jgi:ResB-like family